MATARAGAVLAGRAVAVATGGGCHGDGAGGCRGDRAASGVRMLRLGAGWAPAGAGVLERGWRRRNRDVAWLGPAVPRMVVAERVWLYRGSLCRDWTQLWQDASSRASAVHGPVSLHILLQRLLPPSTTRSLHWATGWVYWYQCHRAVHSTGG